MIVTHAAGSGGWRRRPARSVSGGVWGASLCLSRRTARRLSPLTWDHPYGPDFFTRPELDGLRPLRDPDPDPDPDADAEDEDDGT
jgi:hypothetical protein